MKTLPKVTVGLVLYYGEKYLRKSIPTLLAQKYQGEIEYLFRDQSPKQEAKRFLEVEFPDYFRDKIKIQTGENLGHSGGHNALMRQMSGEYYLCVSNDMLYAPNTVFQIISALESHKDYSVATGKSRIWDFDKNEQTLRIDSAGLALTSSHCFFDNGQCETDFGQYDGKSRIFGASGAFFAVRKQALERIALKNQKGEDEFFDELLHYKNDIDLMYRLFWAGEKCLFVPDALVWHNRQAGKQELGRGKSRQRMTEFMKADSLYGQLVIARKHVFCQKHSFATQFRALILLKARLFYAIFFEPRSLSALIKYWKNRKQIKLKSEVVLRKSDPKDLRKFIQRKTAFGSLKKITAGEGVILDYFKGERVKKNVHSLLNQKTDFSLHLTVADNSNDEGNAKILATLEENRGVKVLIHPQNLGYAKGYNKAATAANGEVIFIINPDIISPHPETLQQLADYLAAHPDVAIVGPKQRNPDGSYEKTARRFPNLIAQLARRSFLKHSPVFSDMVKKYEFAEMDMEKTQEVDWLQSSFWAVRKDFWDYLDGFDEHYSIFMADVEMCWQAWKHGLKVVYFTESEIEADGIRCSRGTIFDICKSRMIRIHSTDAVKFFWRHLFEKNPRF